MSELDGSQVREERAARETHTTPDAARGKADDKGVITLTGEMDDPKTPGAKCKLRDVMKTTDKDAFAIEMWMSDPEHAEEFKVCEVDYTRRR